MEIDQSESLANSKKEKHILANKYFNKPVSSQIEEETSKIDVNKKQIEESDLKFDTTETRFLEISKDKLSAKFIGKGTHPHDIGVIKSNKPLSIPSNSCVAYFEIAVVNSGTKALICVGLSNSEFPLSKFPGWEENSYGYFGEDGKKYNGEGVSVVTSAIPLIKGEPYGPSYSTGDVIGCGINFAKHFIFFTKNGKYLGVAFKKVKSVSLDSGKGKLYPTIGLHSVGSSISANFGQSPFKFDIITFINEQTEQIKQEIKNTNLEVNSKINSNRDQISRIIENYLLYYGYADSLSSFIGKSKSVVSSKSAMEIDSQDSKYEEIVNKSMVNSLDVRKKLRGMIMKGSIEEAIVVLKTVYPSYSKFENNEVQGISSDREIILDSILILKCQIFIELIRISNYQEAIVYAQTHLSSFFHMKKESSKESSHLIDCEKYLQQVIGLLAYSPTKSEERTENSLLSLQHRDFVADSVNVACLLLEVRKTFGESKIQMNKLYSSVLEKLLKHLFVTLKCNFGTGNIGKSWGFNIQL